MGTDIHLVTEKNVGDGWLGVNGFPTLIMTEKSAVRPAAISRNYLLFAALASVRGEGLLPRGLPNDASALSLLMLGDCPDSHSHSWLALEDAIPIFAQHSVSVIDYPGLTHEDAVADYAIYLFGAVGVEFNSLHQWRLVFWFDN